MALNQDRSRIVACIPEAIPAEERSEHFALAQRLFKRSAQERLELPDGYAFRFTTDLLQPLAQFVANERRCCPFITFELSIPAGSGSLWLRMTGPEGTRAALDAELDRGSHVRFVSLCGSSALFDATSLDATSRSQ